MRFIFNSSSAFNLSASLIIASTCSFDKRPLSLVMEIFSFLPVDLSQAETFSMPLASISYVTSNCGTPRGAGGNPVKSNWPSRLQSLVKERSPSNTRIVAAG